MKLSRKLLISIFSLIIILSIVIPISLHYTAIRKPLIFAAEYTLNPKVDEEWALNVSYNPACYSELPVRIKLNEKELTWKITVRVKINRLEPICTAEFVLHYQIFTLNFTQIGNWTVICNNLELTIYVQA